jgi:hypothetical protein
VKDFCSPTAPSEISKCLQQKKLEKNAEYFVRFFFQAIVCSRNFVPSQKVNKDICPEFKDYCGKPQRFFRSMYWMTYFGKYIRLAI